MSSTEEYDSDLEYECKECKVEFCRNCKQKWGLVRRRAGNRNLRRRKPISRIIHRRPPPEQATDGLDAEELEGIRPPAAPANEDCHAALGYSWSVMEALRDVTMCYLPPVVLLLQAIIWSLLFDLTEWHTLLFDGNSWWPGPALVLLQPLLVALIAPRAKGFQPTALLMGLSLALLGCRLWDLAPHEPWEGYVILGNAGSTVLILCSRRHPTKKKCYSENYYNHRDAQFDLSFLSTVVAEQLWFIAVLAGWVVGIEYTLCWLMMLAVALGFVCLCVWHQYLGRHYIPFAALVIVTLVCKQPSHMGLLIYSYLIRLGYSSILYGFLKPSALQNWFLVSVPAVNGVCFVILRYTGGRPELDLDGIETQAAWLEMFFIMGLHQLGKANVNRQDLWGKVLRVCIHLVVIAIFLVGVCSWYHSYAGVYIGTTHLELGTAAVKFFCQAEHVLYQNLTGFNLQMTVWLVFLHCRLCGGAEGIELGI